MVELTVARSELILGGQKSGKSRRAEQLAAAWLTHSPAHRAVLIATAQAHDDEMRARIARHQRERAERVPGMTTLEAPRDLAAAIAQAGGAKTLRVVDCLTLWLTNLLFTGQAAAQAEAGQGLDCPLFERETRQLVEGLQQLPGRIVMVSNEVGCGIVPMNAVSRLFADEQGRLNQRVAAVCERVTLVAAGLPLQLKGA